MSNYRLVAFIDEHSGLCIGGAVDGSSIHTASYRGLEIKVEKNGVYHNDYAMVVDGVMTKDEAMVLLLLALGGASATMESRGEAYAVLSEDVKVSNGVSYVEYKEYTVYMVSEVFGTYGGLLYVTASDGVYTIHSGCYKSTDYREWLGELYNRMYLFPGTFTNGGLGVFKEDIEADHDKYVKPEVKEMLGYLGRVIAYIEGSGL